jgi:hypothetical protein
MHVLLTPEYQLYWLGVSDLPESYQDANTGHDNFLLHSFKFTIHSHFTRCLISSLYCNMTECDYKQVLGWWSDLLDTLIQRVTTLYNSLLHTLMSKVISSPPLLSSGFQQRTFPFPLCSRTVPDFTYQLLTVTAQNDWAPAVLWLQQSESDLHYDWQFTKNQFVLAPSPLRFTTTDFFVVATEPLRS